MQVNPLPDEETEETGAGESALAAANAASSQADATGAMAPEEPGAGAGQSTMADDALVPSPS